MRKYDVQDLFVCDQPERSDCIIVFGSNRDDQLARRALRGSELIQSGFAQWLVLTGKYPPKSQAMETEAAKMKSVVLKNGTPESAIRLEDQSGDTFENVKNCRETLKAIGIGEPRQIIIVSNEWHMFRCRLIMQRYFSGVSLLCCPTTQGGNRDDWDSTDDLRQQVLHELAVLNRQVARGKLPTKQW